MNHIGIHNFLEPVGLLHYQEVFQIKGYDVESDFCTLTPEDLDEMKISDGEHRATLLHAGKLAGKTSGENPGVTWRRAA